MVDVVAAMAFRVATALKDIAPTYADHVEASAKAKIENQKLRYALQKIAEGERYQENGSQYHVGYWGDFARAALKESE